MNLRNFTLLIIGLLALYPTKTSAQVTIGAIESPSPGALLQLKDKIGITNGDANASGGLGMPRIALTTIDKLYPMLSSGYDPLEDAMHVGMLVYNTTFNGAFCPGLYVWKGSQWEELRGRSRPDITVTDIDGNTYIARWYSTDPCDPKTGGQYWFTSNLRVTRNPDGSQLSTVNGYDYAILLGSTDVYEIKTLADLQSGTISYGEDANPITANNKTVSRTEFAKDFGLLYEWDQAAEICPAGWHLPSEAEWEKLLTALGGAAAAGAGMRPNNHYYYMMQNGHDTSNKWGNSDPVGIESSEFNAYPTGSTTSGGSSAVISFGDYTSWWTSDDDGQLYGAATAYGLWYYSPEVYKWQPSKGDFRSVRCVQN